MKEKHLVLWSPGIENHEGRPSANLGDLIIEEAVLREINELFPGWKLSKVSTHLRFGPQQRHLVRSADRIVIGGSNLLSSYMDGYFQWDLTMQNAFAARGAVLMGAGWWRDQGEPNRYTKILLNLVLSRKLKHSVRDGQAKKLLGLTKIRNVLNTGCPTMWPLATMDTAAIRTRPAKKVLCMLTDYYPDPELDQALLSLLESQYETVYFWPQGFGDYLYIQDLDFGGVVLDRSLDALDAVLADEPELDYVGTRLHGGVRCLINGKRCLTLEVDNRAREIGKETHLPTVERDNLDAIKKWTEGSEPVRLNLRTKDIAAWKSQFSS
ncbi:polysaccharide pyruvyl transferase family protein [Puniceicoccales bacterium CK1056]|uniref:Polysaccharide pyruvyl transferase family protein n=1 Tax=Oceanipulchritudo coccoides TaxID=2706888 RepID=A0A6B2M075_9BACT|nr:polysaccharide pyruvyl transferase family protein [Oceanipulchritudo coccoides]NDV62318.1 polysaccharide pyruvyl transferase family protein [Oceanipulchritudo coccoides]